ncbi:MAG: hypothetical protein V7L23_36930 [Nostoc sp.]|uniref:hypothetical protein n=1 Tax=Nostoc sp. TaxID=1180 RepID=UPI002FF045A4
MRIDAPSLYLGSFNSEQFWRDADISQLPAIADQQADAIVSVMDEFQFVFCNSPHDLLVTRLPMDGFYKDYLWELGFSFAHNEFPLIEKMSESGKRSPKGICELLLEARCDPYYQNLLARLSTLSPYSVEPLTEKLCQHYNLQGSGSDIEIVKKVNSKLFSHQLGKHLFPDTVGEIIYSASDLDAVGNRLLQSSPFLIKDEFGVSGKGNLLISSLQILQRIVTYISKQERDGKHTIFLLEPLLNKQTDFSCQLEIDTTGETKILSIQKMLNSGFAFSSIQTAESSFREFLDKSGYFEQVEAIAAELHRVGYFGPVCLDSMVLEDGKIVPMVEINARKSMGLINHHIDAFLTQFSTQGRLMFFSLGLSRHVEFSELLQRMEQSKILFLKDRPKGIIPLASNTFNVNWELHKASANQARAYKGRLYASVVSDNDEEQEQILNRMDNIFAELDIQRFN